MPNSSYLANALSGPVVQAVVQGLQNAIQEPLALIQYWTTLDILTAQDVDGTLNYVGALTGYPRPLVTNVFTAAYILILTDAAFWTAGFVDLLYGLSDAATWPSGTGGELDTALPASNNFMPAAWYRAASADLRPDQVLGLVDRDRRPPGRVGEYQRRGYRVLHPPGPVQQPAGRVHDLGRRPVPVHRQPGRPGG